MEYGETRSGLQDNHHNFFLHEHYLRSGCITLNVDVASGFFVVYGICLSVVVCMRFGYFAWHRLQPVKIDVKH